MEKAVYNVLDFGFKMFLLGVVIALLPESPFNSFVALATEIPFLNYLCWFVPLQPFMALFEVWLQALIIYYGYMAVIRYANGLKGS